MNLRTTRYAIASFVVGVSALAIAVSQGEGAPVRERAAVPFATTTEVAPTTTTAAVTVPAPTTAVVAPTTTATTRPAPAPTTTVAVVAPPTTEAPVEETAEAPPPPAPCPRDGTVYARGSCQVQDGTMPGDPAWTEAKVCEGENHESPADYPCDYDPATWTCTDTHYRTCTPNEEGA